jgi:hypothetical protein
MLLRSRWYRTDLPLPSKPMKKRCWPTGPFPIAQPKLPLYRATAPPAATSAC